MVVFLNVVTFIALGVFVVFTLIVKEEDYSKMIAAFAAFALTLINVFKIPLDIKLGNSWIPEIILVIVWLITGIRFMIAFYTEY